MVRRSMWNTRASKGDIEAAPFLTSSLFTKKAMFSSRNSFPICFSLTQMASHSSPSTGNAPIFAWMLKPGRNPSGKRQSKPMQNAARTRTTQHGAKKQQAEEKPAMVKMQFLHKFFSQSLLQILNVVSQTAPHKLLTSNNRGTLPSISTQRSLEPVAHSFTLITLMS